MLPSLPKACQLVGKNWPYPTAPAEEVAMLRPKSDSTRAIAASRCQGTPQPDSRAARSIVARWSAVSVGTNACQSTATSSVVATSWSTGSCSSAESCSGDGLGCGAGVADGWGVGVVV